MGTATVGVQFVVNTVAGGEQDFTIPIVSPGVYVLEITGVQTKVGLYNPGGVSQLEVCGTSSKGRHQVANVGNWTIKVFTQTPGSVTINLRPWSVLDNWWTLLGWYKSQGC